MSEHALPTTPVAYEAFSFPSFLPDTALVHCFVETYMMPSARNSSEIALGWDLFEAAVYLESVGIDLLNIHSSISSCTVEYIIWWDTWS